MDLAGSPGPHVFVESVEEPRLDADDLHHLTAVLRLRTGDPLTVSDGVGRWRPCTFDGDGGADPCGPVVERPPRSRPVTVAFSLVKGQKPELVVQKLTELGVDSIVVLDAERSIVRWDDHKVASHDERFRRIIREASMQSHRVRLPELELLRPAQEWIASSDVVIAHFGGRDLAPTDRSIAIGPEGGWSPGELASAATRTVSLGETVLRSETAAIAAATLVLALSARSA